MTRRRSMSLRPLFQRAGSLPYMASRKTAVARGLQYLLYFPRAFFGLGQAPARRNARVHHDVAEFGVGIKQWLGSQPGHELLLVRSCQNGVKGILGPLFAQPGGDRQQVQVVVAQYHSGAFAQEFCQP